MATALWDLATAPTAPSSHEASASATRWLPDMTGFVPEIHGSAENGWSSPAFIRGDRDLDNDEKLYAFLVREANGELLQTVTFTPKADELSKDKWQNAFSEAINSDGRYLKAGYWNDSGTFAALPGDGENRLWHPGNKWRAFTTAAAANNWVPSLTLLDAALESTDKIRIEVRDHTTQYRYEVHDFTPGANRLTAEQWQRDLCTLINKDSKMIKAGLQDETGKIVLGAKANSLWVPQCSDLAVILLSVGTWDKDALDKTPAQNSVTGEYWEPKVPELYDETSDFKQITATRSKSIEIDFSNNYPTSDLLIKLSKFAIDKGIRIIGSTWNSNETEPLFRLTTGVHSVLLSERSLGICELTLQDVQDAQDAQDVWEYDYTEYQLSDTAKTSMQPDSAVVVLTIYLDVPESIDFGQEQSLTVGWISPLNQKDLGGTPTVLTLPAPAVIPAYIPTTALCEDMGYTYRSEVFDVSGQIENGVDPRTGLFHAHCVVATLQGLEGLGPQCDLTLHYSALRCNEAGLGDGWAFRFSSFELRDRCLTLASGATVKLTEEEWANLAKGDILKKPFGGISSDASRSTLTIHYPNGQREVLTQPAGDNIEPNDDVRQKIISFLKNIKNKTYPTFDLKKAWDEEPLFGQVFTIVLPSLYYGAMGLDYVSAVKTWRETPKAVDEQIAYFERDFKQYLPSRIISPEGTELALSWERRIGQFLLKQIKSGNKVLMEGTYSHEDVNLSIWPGTQEAHSIVLKLKDFLLMQLVRGTGANAQISTFGYCADPTLDRVLNRVEENDGSVEVVIYEPELMEANDDALPLPAVVLHSVLPGRKQPPLVSYYSYSNNNYRRCFPRTYGPYSYYYPMCRYYWTKIRRSEGPEDSLMWHVYSEKNLPIAECSEFSGHSKKLTQWFYQRAYTTERSQLSRYLIGSLDSNFFNFVASISGDCPETKKEEIYDLRLSTQISAGEPGFGLVTKTITSCLDLAEGNAPTKHTTEQLFHYNGDYQLEYSVAADGTRTQYEYYPRAGGTGVAIKVGDTVLAGPALTNCPAVPAFMDLPIRSEYTFQGSCPDELPLNLTLYGYELNTRQTLNVKHVQTITGARLVGALRVNEMSLSLVSGRTAVLVKQLTTEKTTLTNNTWTHATQENVWWNNHGTWLKTSVQGTYDPQAPSLTIKTSVSSDSRSVQDVCVEQQSAYSGAIQAFTEQGVTTSYQYDEVGRIERETRTQTGQDDEVISWRYGVLPRGNLVIECHASQEIQTTYDGLQRPVQVAVRQAGAPHFCVLSSTRYGDLSEAQTYAYDFLPGGLRRLSTRVHAEGTPMHWVAENISGSEQLIGAETPLLRQTITQEDTSTNGVLKTYRQFLPGNVTAMREHCEEFDAEGRLSKQTFGTGADKYEVELVYDDLGRPVRQINKSGRTLEYRYLGLSVLVTELKVDGTVIASQECEAPSRRLSSTVGTCTYKYDQATDSQASGITLPSKTQLSGGLTILDRGDRYRKTVTVEDKTYSTHTSRRAQDSYVTMTGEPDASGLPKADAFCRKTRFNGLPGDVVQQYRSPLGEHVSKSSYSLAGILQADWLLSGSRRFIFHDQAGRITCLIQDDLRFDYQYDSYDQLTCLTAENHNTNDHLVMNLKWDEFGQETERRYTHNDTLLLHLKQTYSQNGQLQKKELYEGDTLRRTEGYTYNSNRSGGQLLKYQCTGTAATDYPQDESGKGIAAQDFTYDKLCNLLTCDTTYQDGSVRKQQYAYDPKNPTRRVSVAITQGSEPTVTIKLKYDDLGNQLNDQEGRTFAYSTLGKLETILDKDKQPVARYHYDSEHRLVQVEDAKGARFCELLYDNEALIGEVWYDSDKKETRRISFCAGMAQQTHEAGRIKTDFILGDAHSGALALIEAGQLKGLTGYAPFGESAMASDCRFGYNGQWRDPVTGGYHPGNGYRVYIPAERKWLQHDNWSPFGKGGLNGMAYPADPINLHDPSGHIAISRWGADDMFRQLQQSLSQANPMPLGRFWRGLMMTVVIGAIGVLLAVPTNGYSLVGVAILAGTVASVGLDIASHLTAESYPALSRWLGRAALVVGLASTPWKSLITSLVQLPGRMLRWAKNVVSRVLNKVAQKFQQATRALRNLRQTLHNSRYADGNALRGPTYRTERYGAGSAEHQAAMTNAMQPHSGEGGKMIWASPTTTDAQSVEYAVQNIIKKAAKEGTGKPKITVLSGSHGHPTGNRGYKFEPDPVSGTWRESPGAYGKITMENPEAFKADFELISKYGSKADITVLNVGQYEKIPGTEKLFRPMLEHEMLNVLNGTDHVVVGFCHGAVDNVVTKVLGRCFEVPKIWNDMTIAQLTELAKKGALIPQRSIIPQSMAPQIPNLYAPPSPPPLSRSPSPTFPMLMDWL